MSKDPVNEITRIQKSILDRISTSINNACSLMHLCREYNIGANMLDYYASLYSQYNTPPDFLFSNSLSQLSKLSQHFTYRNESPFSKLADNAHLNLAQSYVKDLHSDFQAIASLSKSLAKLRDEVNPKHRQIPNIISPKSDAASSTNLLEIANRRGYTFDETGKSLLTRWYRNYIAQWLAPLQTTTFLVFTLDEESLNVIEQFSPGTTEYWTKTIPQVAKGYLPGTTIKFTNSLHTFFNTLDKQPHTIGFISIANPSERKVLANTLPSHIDLHAFTPFLNEASTKGIIAIGQIATEALVDSDKPLSLESRVGSTYTSSKQGMVR